MTIKYNTPKRINRLLRKAVITQISQGGLRADAFNNSVEYRIEHSQLSYGQAHLFIVRREHGEIFVKFSYNGQEFKYQNFLLVSDVLHNLGYLLPSIPLNGTSIEFLENSIWLDRWLSVGVVTEGMGSICL